MPGIYTVAASASSALCQAFRTHAPRDREPIKKSSSPHPSSPSAYGSERSQWNPCSLTNSSVSCWIKQSASRHPDHGIDSTKRVLPMALSIQSSSWLSATTESPGFFEKDPAAHPQLGLGQPTHRNESGWRRTSPRMRLEEFLRMGFDQQNEFT